MTQIHEALREYNSWWINKFELNYKDREIYAKIKKVLPLKQIIALTGLRRVGKTTLLMKIVKDYLESGMDPLRILYFSFDDFRNSDPWEIIGEYEKIVELDIHDGNFVIIFDEIQKVEDWENKIKRLYDLHSDRIKIIISGSESLFIKKGSKETLGGRLFEYRVEPLSFREYLNFKGIKYHPINIHKEEILQSLEEYIKTQGFPEMVSIKDKEILQKYIKESLLEKVLYRDIPQIFRVRDPSILESILNILLDDPGQLIEVSALADQIGISRQTLSEYLDYLERSYLIRKLYNFSKNRRKTERKLKKYYPTINSVEASFKRDSLTRSKLFESLVINQFKGEFFWRDPYKNEVDLVLLKGDKIYPIEIKYGKIEITGLLRFLKKFNLKRGWIITYDREDTIKKDGKIIEVIPAYKAFIEGIY